MARRRLLKEFRRAVEHRRPWAPVELKLYVTRRCNMGCVMCERARASATDELSTDEIGRILGQAQGLGVREVILFGGEPTVRPDLAAIVRAARHLGMKPLLVSNGWNITPTLADDLVRAGLHGVRLALESPDPTNHDRIRGRSGSFERTRQALLELQEAALRRGRPLALATHTVILRQNFHELPDLVTLLGSFGLTEFVLTPFIPSASTMHPDPGLHPRNRRMGLGRDEIARFNESIAPVVLARADAMGLEMPRERVFVFGESEADLDDAARFLCSRRLVRDSWCYMPWYRVNVFSDGAVVGCAKTRKACKRIGNVREAPLADLWASKAYRRFRRQCATTGVFPKLAGCERCCVHIAQRNVDLHEIVFSPLGPQAIQDRKGFPRYFSRPWRNDPIPAEQGGETA